VGITSPTRAMPVLTDYLEADLISESAQVAPGEAFWVGFHFKIRDGWHIYWRNPGEAGMPTSIEWDLPFGFVAGEIQWPNPKYFEVSKIINFGYEREVVLMAQITPPALIAPGAYFEIKANAEWLGCKDICVPGDAQSSIKLQIAEHVLEYDASQKILFDDFRAQLPVRDSEIRAIAEVDGDFVNLNIAMEKNTGTKATFFPWDPDLVELSGIHSKMKRNRIEWKLKQFNPGSKMHKNLRGYLVFDTAEGEDSVESFWIDTPITKMVPAKKYLGLTLKPWIAIISIMGYIFGALAVYAWKRNKYQKRS
jgi:DsbC/DsbD-like thiol-disulfide interchange protein